MKLITFKGYKVHFYDDPMEFANCEHLPFGDIPEGAIFGGIEDGSTSSGFAVLEDNDMWIYADKKTPFKELLGLMAHEMGHLVEGGFKKNPPKSKRYDKVHEVKAEHYEKFVMDVYELTELIYYHYM